MTNEEHEELVNNLKEAGFKTADEVIGAGDEDLYKVRGVRRGKAFVVRNYFRGALRVSLDPFYAVAKAISEESRRDYPRNAVVMDFQGAKLTVDDFLKLMAAIDKAEK